MQSDKASMLGEVIEYMKQLQAQVGMMSRMNMMMPLPMQQLQMSMMAAAAMGMGMPPPIMPLPAFMPVMPWDIHPPPELPPTDFLPNFFACQSQVSICIQRNASWSVVNVFNVRTIEVTVLRINKIEKKLNPNHSIKIVNDGTLSCQQQTYLTGYET